MRPDLADVDLTTLEPVDPVIADAAAAQRQFAIAERVLLNHGWQVRRTATSTYYAWRRDRARHLPDEVDLAQFVREVRGGAWA